jgi:hypothetical protein
MIDRIKGIFAMEEKVSALEAAIDKAVNRLHEVSAILDAQVSKVASLSTDSKEIILSLKSDSHLLAKELQEVGESRQKLVSEMRELKLAKGKVHEEIRAEVMDEVNREIGLFRTELSAALVPVKEVAASTSQIRAEFKAAIEDLKRFKEIAASLKEKDFTLERHAKLLADADEEKLKLLRRIDGLERMIGQRRSAHPWDRRNPQDSRPMQRQESQSPVR